MNSFLDPGFGIILPLIWIIAIAFAVLCGATAGSIMQKKGRSNGVGWVLGIFLGIFGIIIVSLLSIDESGIVQDKLQTGEYILCVACKEAIHSDATICPHCQTQQTQK
jgi:uncharacterized membrane protein YeaQ/YmgE (transglycosylase-associated protein family)